MQKGEVLLIPNLLGEGAPQDALSPEVCRLVCELQYIVVEEVRTARRFLKKVDKNIDIDKLHFFILNEHSQTENLSEFLQPALQGFSVGLMSEAGVPAMADPGAELVALAHRNQITVRPLSGPSSVLMALIASGLNGQCFAFNGYLPVQRNERIQRLTALERRSAAEHQPQIFIETPYRNMHLIEDMLAHLKSGTRVCIASSITQADEFIVTRTVQEWKKCAIPDLNKKPTVFILQA